MRVIVRSIAALILCFPFVVTIANAAQDEWYTYRHDSARTGAQPWASDLSDPAKVRNLHVVAQFPAEGSPAIPRGFKASPIVIDDTVFIGSVDGYFYALDAASGGLKWQYPKAGDHALRGSCVGEFGGFGGGYGTYGILSSATFAVIGGQRAVIFGAPDPTAEGGLGSARLFALPLSADPNNPQPIWKSDIVAHVTGCISGRFEELHERIAYSSPLVLGDKIYVGIHDTWDSPIQQGRVVAVDLPTGKMTGFQFLGAGNTPGDAHGGGVWNALATDGTSVFFTTGNTHVPWCSYPYFGPNCLPAIEPMPNNGLSMIRVDKDTGSIVWKYQPVPFRMDGDPDWAAGATVMSTSCGELIASVQKDGWSYAIEANQGPKCPLAGHSWQFPPTTKGCPFTKLSQQHGDDDYRRPGAAWNDVFIVRTGGEANTNNSPCPCEDYNCLKGRAACRGYTELHALNACATSEQDRVRWIADIPNNMGLFGHISYSAPTVTGGIVFIGTNQNPNDRKGHLVVIADPSVVPASQQVCSNPDYPLARCTAPYAPVWRLQPLADFAMPDGGSLASMRNEPVLAIGRVFVATNPSPDFPNAGHVYILAPLSPTPVFEANTTIPAKNGATQAVHISVQSWAIAGQEREIQIPLHEFYVAHLLSGEILATIDGQTTERLPGDYWTVKAGAAMRIMMVGEVAVLETTVVSKQ
jgi:outer membrane protein assembly factor BamB